MDHFGRDIGGEPSRKGESKREREKERESRYQHNNNMENY